MRIWGDDNLKRPFAKCKIHVRLLLLNSNNNNNNGIWEVLARHEATGIKKAGGCF